MVTIEHPMTSRPNQKELNVQPQPVQETVVMSPDDEDLVREQIAKNKEAIEQKLKDQEAEREKLLKDPLIDAELKKKRALENLILFNQQHKKKVKVGQVTFTMKLLNANDSDEVYEEVLKLSAEDQVTKTGRMLLAASLVEADGVPLETAYNGPTEIDRSLLQRYYIICGWPAPLTNNLTRAYQQIVKESEAEFEFDFLDE